MCEKQQNQKQGFFSLTTPHYQSLVTSEGRNKRSESDMLGKYHTCIREGVTKHVSSCHRSIALDTESFPFSPQESSQIHRSRAAVGSDLSPCQGYQASKGVTCCLSWLSFVILLQTHGARADTRSKSDPSLNRKLFILHPLAPPS